MSVFVHVCLCLFVHKIYMYNVILASDGIWDALTPQEAFDSICACDCVYWRMLVLFLCVLAYACVVSVCIFLNAIIGK